MVNDLGEIIYKAREGQGLTQHQYGQKYGITAPAVFKFEKGYACPNLDLWLKMGGDAGLAQKRGILMWLRTKLPTAYRPLIEIQDEFAKGSGARRAYDKKGDGKVDYAAAESPERMREETARDKQLPKELREFLNDDELWRLFKPTGHELNMLRDIFVPLGKGSKSSYREALRLIREFTHSFV